MHKLWIYPGCSLRRNPISFWSLQQQMELSQKQKSASPVPGAAWVMQPPARAVSRDRCCVFVREVDEKCCYCLVFFFPFPCFFLSQVYTFVIYQRRVELFHIWQPLGWTQKRHVDKVSATLSFFSHLRWMEKNSWRAQIVLRIPFQPCCCSGPRSKVLFGFDRSQK